MTFVCIHPGIVSQTELSWQYRIHRRVIPFGIVKLSVPKARHPHRWGGATRDWTPISEVWLNPENDGVGDPDKLLETG